MSEKKQSFPSMALLLRSGTNRTITEWRSGRRHAPAHTPAHTHMHTRTNKGTSTKGLECSSPFSSEFQPLLGGLTCGHFIYLSYHSLNFLLIIPNALTRSAAPAVLSIACRDTNTLPCGAVTYRPRHCSSGVTDTWYTALRQPL